jgi:drug/metabolite transporter (DMT)-like permease
MIYKFRGWLIIVSILVGLSIMIGGILIVDKPLGQLSDYYISIIFSLATLFYLFSSVLVIIFREVPRPGRKPIRGFWALFQGFLGLILSMICEFYFLNLLLHSLR